MEFIDEPCGFTTLICGQPIIVIIPQLVKWFSTLEIGEQIYAYRKWPKSKATTPHFIFVQSKR
jgi:hypothetical protein